MHLLQVISILLSFVMISSAKTPVVSVAQGTSLSNLVNTADFQIFNLTLLTTPLSDNLTSNHTLSFIFMDPNSNGTNTTCSSSWITSTNGTNSAPTSYILCKPAANKAKGFFEWKFTAITNLLNFGLRFAHQFSDPVNYPPPYDLVTYFSDANVTLTCQDAAGTCCQLPALNATINWLSN